MMIAPRRYKAAQFIGILLEAKPLIEFDIELYFAMVGKMTVVDRDKIIVAFFDGTEIECEFE